MAEKDSKTVKFDTANHIMLNEFYFLAKVKEEIVEKWITEGKLEIIQTTAGKAITFDSFHKLANTQEWIDERNNALVAITPEQIRSYSDENDKFLMNIKYYIHEIAKVHKKYKDKFNFDSQSAEFAAYLLFAKAISISKSISILFEAKNLNGMMLFRPLNEAIQLAEYFLNSKDTQEGKGKLNAWFNKNSSPFMKTIRATNNRKSKPVFDKYNITDFVENNQLSIHAIQSKSVHNTFNDIYRLFGFFRQTGKLDWFIEYAETTNIIELNESLQYLMIILPSIIRGFQICFQNIMLSPEELMNLEKMFWQIRQEYKDLINNRKKD